MKRLGLVAAAAILFASAASAGGSTPVFPPALESYTGEEGLSLFPLLASRVRQEPLNLVATLIFALAILHTFLATRITRLAHELKSRDTEHSFKAEAAHFFGEVEAVFGIWVVPLLAVVTLARGWHVAITYLASLVPGLTEDLKYAVVSGAMVAGGLTVIANAPNPAGQAILGRFFPAGVAPAYLAWALPCPR
jgi:hypothetical protein